MTEEQLHKQTEQQELKASADKPSENKNKSKSKRRRLIKAAVSIPVIMTLHSGAALAARTSNYVLAEKFVDNAVRFDNVDGEQLLCVHPDTKMTQSFGDKRYDVGDPAIASLGRSGDPIGKQHGKCQSVGGIMISATAYSSIQDKLIINVTTL